MKKILLVTLVCLGWAGYVYSDTKQAESRGATKIIVPSTADIDALTITQNDTGQAAINVTAGGVRFAPLTITQINALTPPTSGYMYFCSNCTDKGTICISTGTSVNSTVLLSSMTRACQ